MPIPWELDPAVERATKAFSHGFEHIVVRVPIGELYEGGECDVCKELGMTKDKKEYVERVFLGKEKKK